MLSNRVNTVFLQHIKTFVNLFILISIPDVLTPGEHSLPATL